MIEFVNRNLEKTEPDYFYRVSEFVTTFGMDEGKNEPFSHFEDFKGNDLHDCKAKAEKHYWERLEGLEQGKYFLPFEAPETFEFGKNAAFSITLSLVEYYTDDEYFEHPLIGEDDQTTAESKEIEAAVLNKK
ncbi:MAG: hypothetical protein U0T31_11205 [Chitinophagales bacterium]